jgi:ABC-type antimicrobial peptide transport system permease subunit
MLAVPGAVLGVILGLGVARSLNSLLFGVVPYDPMSFVLVPIILIATAAAAVSVPARRATAIDPVSVLRSE